MNEEFDFLKDFLSDEERELQDKVEQLRTRMQARKAMEQVVEDAGRALRDKSRLDAEVDDLMEQLNRSEEREEALKAQLKALKQENTDLKMQVSELSKVTTKVAERTEHEELLGVFRKFLNTSTRKTARKRGYIKSVILEMTNSASLLLPRDIQEKLDSFDDEEKTPVNTMVQVGQGGINIQQVDKLEA